MQNVLLQSTYDCLKCSVDLKAKGLHGDDDNRSDQCNHHAVFNCSCAGLVDPETSNFLNHFIHDFFLLIELIKAYLLREALNDLHLSFQTQ